MDWSTIVGVVLILIGLPVACVLGAVALHGRSVDEHWQDDLED